MAKGYSKFRKFGGKEKGKAYKIWGSFKAKRDAEVEARKLRQQDRNVRIIKSGSVWVVYVRPFFMRER